MVISPNAPTTKNISNAVTPPPPGGLGCVETTAPGPTAGHKVSDDPHRGQNRAPAGVRFQHRGHRTDPSIQSPRAADTSF